MIQSDKVTLPGDERKMNENVFSGHLVAVGHIAEVSLKLSPYNFGNIKTEVYFNNSWKNVLAADYPTALGSF